ncbi:MAG: hypothetical protein HY716_04155 [Planctomycetes bacterium]|nr:hypothetical protein [Planctomycetota bacterium]
MSEPAQGLGTLPRDIHAALKTDPTRVPQLLTGVDLGGAPDLWRTALAAVNLRLGEIIRDVPERGLDRVVREVRDLLMAVWVLESAGALRFSEEGLPVVNRFANAIQSAMRKIAPPLPKKVKLNAPTRKVLPLSPTAVAVAFDDLMLLRGLIEIGDYTRQPDKERDRHVGFLDDWRRQTWEGARVASWERCRELVLSAPIDWSVPGRRFSREAAMELLEAIHRRRQDHITRIPNVSMLACQRCGRFEGRERVRCSVCSRMFCGRCRARTSDLCLADYVRPRYGNIPPETRLSLGSEARNLCARYRLDEHTRDEAFVKALAEMDIKVTFMDAHPAEGAEEQDAKGIWHLRLKHREYASTKRQCFAAMARATLRRLALPADADLEAYFVDTCLGIPIEDALTWNDER